MPEAKVTTMVQRPPIEGGISEVEIISQQIEEETKSIAPVQLVNFAYRDLPLAALDLSVAGSQLLSNLDEEYQREGSNWLKPCCGRRAAVWQVFLLSASLNSFLVACVVLVVILLTLELLIDIKLLQFSNASQFAGVIHWISLVILSVFFSEFEIRQLRAHLAQQDLDLAAEREAALQVPHMLNKQSSNRYKVVAAGGDSDDEATENISELRAPRETMVKDDMNNYISQYYNEPSSDSGVPEGAICVITTAAIDVHHPNISSDLFTVDVPMKIMGSNGTSASVASGSASRSTDSSVTRAQSDSSQTFGSSTDCSTTREESSEYCPLERACHVAKRDQVDSSSTHSRVNNAVVQELLSSLSDDSCLTQKGLDPVNLKLPSPSGSTKASPELEHRVNIYNRKNQESFGMFQIKPVIHFQQNTPVIDKYTPLESKEQKLNRVPDS
ncbi:transmembrane protein 266 isoform X6 [Podarcis muralis]|uniref:transmembrane protein 266 isoform X7 n=1 Tax=Podarcis muralis TaxID=64176 RepID=UPI0010A001A6|nr:transmembrane protein 266 isoform X7 [Podarcis muralis]